MDQLIRFIASYPRALVAFSGGADSTLVLYAARQALGRDNVLGVMIDSVLQPHGEADHARKVAETIDAPLAVRTVDPLQCEAVRMNRRDRCYHCKSLIFNTICGLGEEYTLMDGTNADDCGEYRPGMRAVEEFLVVSPLKKLGYRKTDVRRLLAEYHLPVSNRPASPCLATRVPYDTALDPALLDRIGSAERAVINLGYSFCRVRSDGVYACVELPGEELGRTSFDAVIHTVMQFGFSAAQVDPNGYQSGRYDKELES